MLLNGFRIAVKALSQHKLRTALTMLGMTIGVAAVIAMVAVGDGAQQTVTDDVASAGTTFINVSAGNFTRGGEESNIAAGLGASSALTVEDAEEIGRIAGVRNVAKGVKFRSFIAQVDVREFVPIVGTDVAYPKIHLMEMKAGEFFTAQHVSSASAVAVIGPALRDRLFPEGSDPIGKQVRIKNQTFELIGVTDEPPSATGDEEELLMAYVPYTTLQRTLGIKHLHTVAVGAARAGETTRISADIRALLRKRHHLDTREALQRAQSTGLNGNQMPAGPGGIAAPDDFTVKTQAAEALTKGLNTSVSAFVLANMPRVDETNMQEMAGTLNRAGATMTILLAAIATISLVVGGIGIMNIMLVSVTERTREIGIRRAVGAKSRHILLQFLIEAVTLGLFGGIVGILLGFVTGFTVTRLLDWPVSFSLSAVVLAFGISGVVGVFFGFYPARRASLLDPINALRTE